MESHLTPASAPKGTIDLTTIPEDDRERVWYENYYQGDTQPQLTARAVVMGMFLGGVMSLSNLYVGLKTGWGLGVAITACILSYAIWTSFLKIGLAKTQMSILENNCMQSTASSAGYSTGGTMVSCIAAYLIITGENIPFGVLFAWTAFLALLGVSIAVPMKRQMINREQLKFPSGIAAAETLKSLHAAGDEAVQKGKALFVALGVGAVIAWLLNGQAALMTKLGFPVLAKYVLPAEYGVFGKTGAEKFGIVLPGDPLLIAAGAIVGMRTSLSMAAGGVILYAIMGPWLEANGVFTEMHALGAIKTAAATPGNVKAWGLWTGSAMMVTAGLTAFAFQWRSIVRAFAGLGAMVKGVGTAGKAGDPMDAIEVPNSWFAMGTLVSGAGCVFLMQYQWGIQWYWGIISVAFAFVLSLVACRATGETDITPIGAMGKVTQLFYGVTIPQNATANLMTAGVTAGAAGSAADLLTDLKSGYLLGANPRKQFIAQALGIIAGTLVVVPVWYILVPNAETITGDNAKFAAPAAAVWAAVSKLLANGIGSLHPTILVGMGVGAAAGIGLTIAENLAPANIKKWLPSATGLGLAFVIMFPDSMAFLIGAALALLYKKINEKGAEMFIVPISSGIIAGESILGILIALLQAKEWL
ncbi:MAG: OPT family oligopeptide transporter [Pseudomonadota bacterium]|nr:OPT family oligopeptide transporter [Pseudomonadota bacterium]